MLSKLELPVLDLELEPGLYAPPVEQWFLPNHQFLILTPS